MPSRFPRAFKPWVLEEHRGRGGLGCRTPVWALTEGKNKSLRLERKLGQKMQQVVCKRMIQAALIWICSLAKTQRWRSSLSVSGDDKRQRGKSRGRSALSQLQHLGNDTGIAAAPRGPAPALINHGEKGLSLLLFFL